MSLLWCKRRVYMDRTNMQYLVSIPLQDFKDDKTSVSSAYDCRCHTSTSSPPPRPLHSPLTSPESLKTVVLPVLHAAGVAFHLREFVHVREAKQRFKKKKEISNHNASCLRFKRLHGSNHVAVFPCPSPVFFNHHSTPNSQISSILADFKTNPPKKADS